MNELQVWVLIGAFVGAMGAMVTVVLASMTRGFDSLRNEMGSLRNEMGSLRNEMVARFDATNTKIDHLDDDVSALAKRVMGE